MYKAARELSAIRPEELDQYLSRGWFRTAQGMLTTQFMQDQNFTYRDVIWLRHKLSAFHFPKWFYRMKKNTNFSVFIDDAHPTATHEFLYQRYLDAKPHYFPSSLESILYGDKEGTIFNTKVINIWCGEELAAAGFLDMGVNSAAGIVNIYDPRFSKHSLGKFLYYLAAEYAIEQGMQFFYPGCFAPGNTHHLYKLTMERNSLEFFHSIYEAWYPFRLFKEENLQLPLMERKLSDVYLTLEDMGIQAYYIYNAHYKSRFNSKWDVPAAVYIVPEDPRASHFAITYDVNTRRFYIFDCTELQLVDSLRVSDKKLLCYEKTPLNNPVADEYHFDAAIKRLNELIAC